MVFDGSKVFKVGRMTELEDAAKIYIDTLFPEIYDEVLELLRRGVGVYLLKDATKLKKLRMESNMRKTDENDSVPLSRIPREAFRPLTAEELELKIRIEPLISEYRQIVRWKKTLKNLISRGFVYNFRETLRLMEADRKRLSRKIVKQVTALPIYGEVYKKACEALGIKKSTELAILTIELPLHLPLAKLKGLLGLIPGGNEGKCNHKLRNHLVAFAAGLYISVRKGANFSNKVTEAVNCLPKEQAMPKLQLAALKVPRMMYLTAVKSLAGGQLEP